MDNKEKLELYNALKEQIIKNKHKLKTRIKEDELIQFLLKIILLEESKTKCGILKYLDLENINFDDQDVTFVDFTDTNANIDPQKVHLKHLGNTKLFGDFKDKSFDDVCICGTDFTEARNVKINPQKVKYKKIINAKVNGVDFGNYSFEGIDTTGTNFDETINCILKEKNEFEKYKQKIKNIFKD